jgi:hypothetical protein
MNASVDLYWIPLGAGARVVRLSGAAFEAIDARLHGRQRRDLFHSALVVVVPEGRYIVEQTPVPDGRGGSRGVVVEGSVGTAVAGRFRPFRYEIRRWRNGRIPDIGFAISSPERVSTDPTRASRLLDLVPAVPPLVWGRDERRTGEMWNSNSVIAWLLTCSGLDAHRIHPPARGRAPGWRAGIVVASRDG